MSQGNERPSNTKKFATALEFLEQIKRVFYGLNRPNVYTDFLLVMQDFKTNTYSFLTCDSFDSIAIFDDSHFLVHIFNHLV